jgi:hypothetical protein
MGQKKGSTAEWAALTEREVMRTSWFERSRFERLAAAGHGGDSGRLVALVRDVIAPDDPDADTACRGNHFDFRLFFAARLRLILARPVLWGRPNGAFNSVKQIGRAGDESHDQRPDKCNSGTRSDGSLRKIDE